MWLGCHSRLFFCFAQRRPPENGPFLKVTILPQAKPELICPPRAGVLRVALDRVRRGLAVDRGAGRGGG